jgi:signal transduction histidine kinase/CheY-like chemotaxis protein
MSEKSILEKLISIFSEISSKNSYHRFAYRSDQKNIDLSKSFNFFSKLILLLLFFWFFINSSLIYRHYKNLLDRRIQFQIQSIDKAILMVFDSVATHINLIGDKSLDLEINKNPKLLKNFLKKTTNHDIEKNNVSSWIELELISRNYQIDSIYPILEAKENKSWKLIIGNLAQIKKEEDTHQILPIAMRIDDYNLKEIGIFLSAIDVEIINKQIESTSRDSDVCFLVVNKNHDIISHSKNLIITENQKKSLGFLDKINWYLPIKNPSIEEISDKIDFAGCTFSHSKKIAGYDFFILAGYNKNNFKYSFLYHLSSSIFPAIGVVAIFFFIIFFFRRARIKPFVKELIDAKNIAESSNTQKSQFLSILNHELRTPMNGIVGISQSLIDSNKMSDEEKEQINILLKSSESLLSILNDILSFSNIVENKIKIEQISFNIISLVEDVVDLMSISANAKGLEMILDIDDNIEEFFIGDPIRIRQVMINIINNAIKFSFKGQIVIRVKLAKKIKDKFLINFSIQDSGIGISEEKIKNMFKQTIQSDFATTRKFDGTGIGLTICKGLIDLMNGVISIDSKENFGTKIFFEIPLAKSKAKTFDPFDEKKLKLKGKKIFIVCENDQMREVVIKSLDRLKMTNYFPRISKYDNPKNKINQIINDLKNTKELDVILLIHTSQSSFSILNLIEKINDDLDLKKIPKILSIAKIDRSNANPEILKNIDQIIHKPIRKEILISSLLKVMKIYQNKSEDFGVVIDQKNIDKESEKKLKILLCEDNEINIKVALLMMKKYNHQIDVAENGSEGVEKFRENKYDLILMDCMMPIMDGFEATKKIREIEAKDNLSPTKIFALSANASEEDQIKCLDSGMDKFITKPIRREIIEQIFASIK